MCLYLSEVYGARTLLYADYKVLYGSGSILNIFCEVHVLFIVKTVSDDVFISGCHCEPQVLCTEIIPFMNLINITFHSPGQSKKIL